jgi:hypothetical protein
MIVAALASAVEAAQARETAVAKTIEQKRNAAAAVIDP